MLLKLLCRKGIGRKTLHDVVDHLGLGVEHDGKTLYIAVFLLIQIETAEIHRGVGVEAYHGGVAFIDETGEIDLFDG